MATRKFKLPDLGEGLEDAEVVRWLVAEGDQIALNQPIVEVDTAKALVEIPSPFAGVVVTLHASDGDVVKVGADLISVEVSGDHPSKGSVLVGYGVDEEQTSSRRRRLSTAATSKGTVLAAPPVRKLAQELGVDLQEVTPSGPGGRVTREDVQKAASDSAAPKSRGPERRIPVKGVRRVVAKRMAESASTIPHVTTYLTVDATVLLETREKAKPAADRVTALSVVARGLLEICKAHPKLNASWDESEIVLKEYYHLGVATDTDRGLMVPVVKDAGSKSIAELAAEITRVTADARDGDSRPEDLTGSTITISNVGSFGAEYGTPIINPGESSILAMGVIEDRPAARGNKVVVAPQMTLSLSFDHRIADGAEAGRALRDLKDLLEDASALEKLLT